MNCKPGELVVIVGGDMPEDMPTLGLIVRVTKIDPNWYEPVWEYEGETLCDIHGAKLVALSDRFLRPIRPNGITTEEVKELFSPSPAKESEKV